MKYAVAIINFFDNENKVFLVEANGDSEAMAKAILLSNKTDDVEEIDEDYIKWVNDLANKTVEEIQNICFDADMSISEPVKV